MKKITLCFFALTFCFANAHEDSAYWRQVLQPYSDKFAELLRHNDLEGTLEIYDDNVVLMAPLSPPLIGKKALKQEIKEARQMGIKYQSISGTTAEVWGCENQIFERGTLAFSYITKKNEKPQAYYGSFISIWQKQEDGTYRIKYSIWNLDFNPWEN